MACLCHHSNDTLTKHFPPDWYDQYFAGQTQPDPTYLTLLHPTPPLAPGAAVTAQEGSSALVLSLRPYLRSCFSCVCLELNPKKGFCGRCEVAWQGPAPVFAQGFCLAAWQKSPIAQHLLLHSRELLQPQRSWFLELSGCPSWSAEGLGLSMPTLPLPHCKRVAESCSFCCGNQSPPATHAHPLISAKNVRTCSSAQT